MNDGEAIAFLQKYLGDYERHAALVQQGFRGWTKEATAEDNALVDSLAMRKPRVWQLFRAARRVVPLLDPSIKLDARSMADLRMTFLEVIGAFQHGMVNLKPERPAPPVAPASSPSTSDPRPVTADDVVALPLTEVLGAMVRGRHLWPMLGMMVALLLAGGGAGWGIGYVWGGLVEKKAQEHAVEKLTSERNACREEMASLKTTPPKKKVDFFKMEPEPKPIPRTLRPGDVIPGRSQHENP